MSHASTQTGSFAIWGSLRRAGSEADNSASAMHGDFVVSGNKGIGKMRKALKSFTLTAAAIALTAGAALGGGNSRLAPELQSANLSGNQEVIVQYNAAPTAQQQQTVTGFGGTIHHTFPHVKGGHVAPDVRTPILAAERHRAASVADASACVGRAAPLGDDGREHRTGRRSGGPAIGRHAPAAFWERDGHYAYRLPAALYKRVRTPVASCGEAVRPAE